jgi:hypothetical protein
LAATFARTGKFPLMSAEGFSFNGDYDFRQTGGREGKLVGDPLAVMKMAFKSAGNGRPILRADGLNYSGNPELRAIVMVLAHAMKENMIPVALRPAQVGQTGKKVPACGYC